MKKVQSDVFMCFCVLFNDFRRVLGVCLLGQGLNFTCVFWVRGGVSFGSGVSAFTHVFCVLPN
jgi:hypothetical protein